MTKSLPCTTASILTLVLYSQHASAENFTPTANVGVFSQYVDRGQPQGAGETSIQADIGLEHESGFSSNIWIATGVGDDTEYDFALDYASSLAEYDYNLGLFTYSYLDATADNSFEVYGSLARSFFAATIYLSQDYNYFEIGASRNHPELFDTEILIGYDDSTTTFDASFSISRDYDMSSYTMTPSFSLAKAEGADIEVVFGINAGF